MIRDYYCTVKIQMKKDPINVFWVMSRLLNIMRYVAVTHKTKFI